MFLEKNVNIFNEDNDQSIHVSGHPCKDEILDMYKMLKPKTVIPVHGNFEQLKANAEIAKSCKVKKILIPKNGDIFQFVDDNPACVDRIEMDTKVFDGEKVVSLKDEKFSIRKQALWNGILMASIVLDNRGNLISVPILTELGISKTEKMKKLRKSTKIKRKIKEKLSLKKKRFQKLS